MDSAFVKDALGEVPLSGDARRVESISGALFVVTWAFSQSELRARFFPKGARRSLRPMEPSGIEAMGPGQRPGPAAHIPAAHEAFLKEEREWSRRELNPRPKVTPQEPLRA